MLRNSAPAWQSLGRRITHAQPTWPYRNRRCAPDHPRSHPSQRSVVVKAALHHRWHLLGRRLFPHFPALPTPPTRSPLSMQPPLQRHVPVSPSLPPLHRSLAPRLNYPRPDRPRIDSRPVLSTLTVTTHRLSGYSPRPIASPPSGTILGKSIIPSTFVCTPTVPTLRQPLCPHPGRSVKYS